MEVEQPTRLAPSMASLQHHLAFFLEVLTRRFMNNKLARSDAAPQPQRGAQATGAAGKKI